MHSNEKECLTDFQIAGLIEGTLPLRAKEECEKAIMDCEECWSRYVSVKAVIRDQSSLADEDVPEHMLRQAIEMFPGRKNVFDLVVEYIGDALRIVERSDTFTVLTPLPAGVRSGKTEAPKMVVLKKSFESIEVELDIESISKGLCNIRVQVETREDTNLINTLQVELRSGDRALFSTSLERGEAVLEDLRKGKYSIVLRKNNKVFGDIALKIQ